MINIFGKLKLIDIWVALCIFIIFNVYGGLCITFISYFLGVKHNRLSIAYNLQIGLIIGVIIMNI